MKSHNKTFIKITNEEIYKRLVYVESKLKYNSYATWLNTAIMLMILGRLFMF